MATASQLNQALINAKRAGNTEDANIIAAELQRIASADQSLAEKEQC